MHRLCFAAGALRHTRLLLAYNKSSGYRWSPIPKPPPPHYDRLYGVHSVLNALRVAAVHRQKQQAQSSLSSSTAQAEREPGSSEGKRELKGSQHTPPSTAAASGERVAGSSGLHPHRAHFSCLYVRDFSAEEGVGDQRRGCSTQKVHGRDKREMKLIPARYTAVRCIAALAKSLDVPVRFVSRSELVQLCGERRNQNVVLEASSYVPHDVERLDDIWRVPTDGAVGVGVTEGRDSRDPILGSSPVALQRELVLFLEHIVDPTNIGGILRTAYFYGVDHVILSRDCAACTAAVSRTSTGFLEHLWVHRATVPTADFLRASLQGSNEFDVIASAVVAGEPAQASEQKPSLESTEEAAGGASEANDAEKAETKALTDLVSARKLNARLLLLGNEDAGLPAELLRWCTHVAHVRSPRQRRLRQARGTCRSAHSTLPQNSEVTLDRAVNVDSEHQTSHESCVEARSTPSHPLPAVERREHSLRRLARIREKEVSLNVNTATAALLTALVAVEGKLPRSASYGMVEVRSYTS
ncbi:hypothetical protein ABL78_6436 [Leptomonas seymouri]|uniref:tRNA/rRNA methyltransferase SpoU type domain-containing protein n=1 Tax=Leptomonas seymouri TaxID=5684 RepID=A0A0N1I3C1_LEPSE|nr:hypothetical protein ABL78_6436 [Leptomonas seymouri]|eukprot:KPI84501.1 hypothetical protein ABL78_6436 [Leptomonas seymouri]